MTTTIMCPYQKALGLTSLSPKAETGSCATCSRLWPDISCDPELTLLFFAIFRTDHSDEAVDMEWDYRGLALSIDYYNKSLNAYNPDVIYDYLIPPMCELQAHHI